MYSSTASKPRRFTNGRSGYSTLHHERGGTASAVRTGPEAPAATGSTSPLMERLRVARNKMEVIALLRPIIASELRLLLNVHFTESRDDFKFLMDIASALGALNRHVEALITY